jgi:Lrp/AsnC family transcriptional regulator
MAAYAAFGETTDALLRRSMNQIDQLDAIDRRIVSALQDDGTLSNADLAQRVGASSASCWRRVKALEAAGVLTRTVRLVDPAAVGRGVNVLCNVRMRSHAIEARQAFEAFVDGRPEIVESFSMSGEWDYLLRIVVADVSDYNHFLMQVMLGQSSVAGASSHFALSMTKYTTAIPV